MSPSSFWGAFKALSWFSKFGGVTAIPFVGPVLGILGGLLQLVWMAIKAFVKGLGKIVSDPLAAASCACIGLFLLVVGIKLGVKYDAHLVTQARTELASLEMQLKGIHNVDASKARAAIEQREIAKREVLVSPVSLRPDEVVTSVPPPASPPAAKRVRKRPAEDDNDLGSYVKRMLGF